MTKLTRIEIELYSEETIIYRPRMKFNLRRDFCFFMENCGRRLLQFTVHLLWLAVLTKRRYFGFAGKSLRLPELLQLRGNFYPPAAFSGAESVT